MEKDLYKLSAGILEYKEVDEFRRGTLSILEALFEARSSSFFLAHNSGSKINLNDIVGSHNFPQDHALAYREQYHRLDPFYTKSTFTRDVVTIDEIVSLKELESSRFYNEFLRDQLIYHGMCINLFLESKLIGTVFLCRPKGKKAFTPFDKIKAALIRPILISGLERSILKGCIAQQKEISDYVALGPSCKGVIALDEYMETIYTQGFADKFLEEELSTEKNKIYKHIKEIKKLSANNCLERPTDYSLSLKKENSSITALLSYHPCSKFFLIRFVDKPPVESFEQKAIKFRFTKREKEIVQLVCMGLKNRQIAEKLYISNRTVENHLRVIFEKAAVRNRTRLAHLLNQPATPA